VLLTHEIIVTLLPMHFLLFHF